MRHGQPSVLGSAFPLITSTTPKRGSSTVRRKCCRTQVRLETNVNDSVLNVTSLENIRWSKGNSSLCLRWEHLTRQSFVSEVKGHDHPLNCDKTIHCVHGIIVWQLYNKVPTRNGSNHLQWQCRWHKTARNKVDKKSKHVIKKCYFFHSSSLKQNSTTLYYDVNFNYPTSSALCPARLLGFIPSVSLVFMPWWTV